MSTQANYFKIGLFTIAAVALLVVAIIAWGAGAFASERVIVETYVNETVQGVDVGTPVKYRGVQVGNVESIMFTYNVYERRRAYGERRGYVLLRMALNPRAIADTSAAGLRTIVAEMVENGLRVRLRPQGLTGLSYVEMDYIADPELYPQLEFDWVPDHIYLPSAPSLGANLEESVFSINRTLKQIEKANIGRLAEDLNTLLVSASDFLTDTQVRALRDDAGALVDELRRTNDSIRALAESEQVAGILTDVAGTASSVRGLVDGNSADLDATVRDIRRVAADMRTSTAALPETMEQLTRSLRKLNALLTEQQRQITTTLDNLEATSANLRDLTDEARRYPAHVLFGDAPPPVEERP